MTVRAARVVVPMVVAFAVAFTPATARAAGEGTVTPGITDDPFAGSPATVVERGSGSTFRFFGSGFGHGLGMSQWGANGLAEMGWRPSKIVKHFFRGTRVERAGDPVRRLRVGLAWDVASFRLGAREGPVELWLGREGGRRIDRIPAGQTWKVRATEGGFAIRDEGGTLVGGHAWGRFASDLVATYPGGARAFVDDPTNGGITYNRGHLEVDLYRKGGRARQRLVMPLRLEQYLYGLGEMPSSWPASALGAQAIAGRTFATYKVRRFRPNAACGCDITDGTNDQVYVGYAKEGGADGDRWVAAVDGTRGRVVTHKGRVIQAFYAASDGGHSDAVEDVWHGGDRDFAIPYLKAECDPGEDAGGSPWLDWQISLSASSLTSRLAPYTGPIGRVRGFTKVRRGDGGRVITATVRGGNGSARITGSQLRWAIGAWDGRIWIEQDRNITGPIRNRYDAERCRPGLPRSPIRDVPGGARQRFQKGAIYRNGADGVTVWLRGAVEREYRTMDGPQGRLGMPVGQTVDIGAGTRTMFQGGRILWKRRAGANALWGRVLDEYLGRGGTDGPLGYPTTRVRDDGAGGALAGFEHGTIVCPDGQVCRLA